MYQDIHPYSEINIDRVKTKCSLTMMRMRKTLFNLLMLVFKGKEVLSAGGGGGVYSD